VNRELRDSKEIVLTSDGSTTMYSKEFDECYHSTKDGALQESLRKHIIPALTLADKEGELTILDICFGLGFNVLATLYYREKYNLKAKKLKIISFEMDTKLIHSLKDFNYPKEFESFKGIIESLSRDFFYQDDITRIEILTGDARERIKDIKDSIDIAYQDAFSPKKNPTLWSVEWFRDIKNLARDNLILTTYSIATPVRLSLYKNGFYIYQLKGDGVRDSTIASLKRLNLGSIKSLKLKFIDMELKLQRNPNAKPIWDK
jgi:tRNA U34 5-methylaminomethyl-2-thiouridine-forming methyltransferase MnmC